MLVAPSKLEKVKPFECVGAKKRLISVQNKKEKLEKQHRNLTVWVLSRRKSLILVNKAKRYVGQKIPGMGIDIKYQT